MRRHLSISLLALACAGSNQARASGTPWNEFGPDRSSGAFINITREHLIDENAQGIAVDRGQRVLVLGEWAESGSTNRDCAVTRHLRQARLLDMDYTGPEQLEATRRITLDMGGSNLDVCNTIDTDSLSRAVVIGNGTYDSGTSGFIVRLNATGAYDTTFTSDGKFALKNLAAFSGLTTRLNHMQVMSDNRIMACGYVQRGTDRNMLAIRVNAAGAIDTSFNGNGFVEVDFDGGGDDSDICTRLALLPDGDVMLGGTSANTTGDPIYALVRLHSNGSFDTGFADDGRLRVGTGSDLAATPSVADLAYDASRNRLLVACNLVFAAALLPSGCVMAIKDNGSFDNTFNSDGRIAFRFSSYGTGAPRELGATRLRRLLARDDGSFYVLGTHYNSAADSLTYGDSDIVSMRMQANGSVSAGSADDYSSDGITFHTFTQVAQKDVDSTQDRKVADGLIDATWYRGNLLLLGERPRYPNNVFDHDGDGNLNEPGPIAPLVASILAERIFSDDLEFDGLDVPTGGLIGAIPVPAGYGNYCSVTNPNTSSNWGLTPGLAGSDPCGDFLDGNPNLTVQRSGLFSLSGTNWVVATCDGNFVVLFGGIGGAPFSSAFNASAGRNNCIFTAVPEEMAIFSRPYTGAHVGNAQSFNHDGYNIAIGVAQFGQPAGAFDACFIDNRGRQRSFGNPATGDCQSDGSGVDEPASDIPVDHTRLAVALATGRVIMAVPRHVPPYSPPGNDPWQREVFVRYQVGIGRYAEIFTSYSAHMQNTLVRRGDLVATGDTLGRIGTTGASTGEHLHLSVHRNKNLTYRRTFEFQFEGGRHDRTGSVSAIDAWGWQAPIGVDPWAWRFRDSSNDDHDDAGSFSTKLWINGEQPTLN